MNCYDLLLIDPPMSYFTKKDVDVSSLLEIQETPYLAFNPGLLSIGSYIIEKNYSVKLHHIKSDTEIEEAKAEILKFGIPKMIAISCSYFQTYETCLGLVEYFSKTYPESILVIGGLHAGNMPGYVLEDSPYIDLVLSGEGEGTIEDLLNFIVKKQGRIEEIGGISFGEKFLRRGYEIDKSCFDNCAIIDFIDEKSTKERIAWGTYTAKKAARLISLDDMPFLHYDLYKDYKSYTCYVEESRGCYGKCEYCVAPIHGGFRYKKAERFLKELDRAVSIFGLENSYPFLASNFGVDVENTVKILEGIIDKYGSSLRWNAEFRVDLNWEKYIDLMYQSGCRGFNIGMDSPCSTVLLQMNKTNNTMYYLKKTYDLIDTVSKYGDAAIVVNMMVYPGEDAETILASIKFISKYYHALAAVHYSPTNVYYDTILWKNFNKYHERYGTTIVKSPYFDRVHIYPVNPSMLFDNNEANYWARIIEKLFCNKSLFADYHETRLTRDKNGALTDEDRSSIATMYTNNLEKKTSK